MNILIAAIAIKAFSLVNSELWAKVLLQLVFVNLFLALFNLIPIPPLDGSRVLQLFLPRKWLYGYFSIEPYGVFIVIAAMMFFRPIGDALSRIVYWAARALSAFLT
jgi:Zn-dependent protease